jgi:hypothetical protein
MFIGIGLPLRVRNSASIASDYRNRISGPGTI